MGNAAHVVEVTVKLFCTVGLVQRVLSCAFIGHVTGWYHLGALEGMIKSSLPLHSCTPVQEIVLFCLQMGSSCNAICYREGEWRSVYMPVCIAMTPSPQVIDMSAD